MDNVKILYLVAYFFGWLLFFVLYQRKKKIFDLGSLLILSYTIYALSSIVLYIISFTYSGTDIHLINYVYLFIILIIAIKPLTSYNYTAIDHIKPPSKLLLNSVSVLIILCSIPRIIKLPDLFSNLFTLFSDQTVGLDMYVESVGNADKDGKGIDNIYAIFSNMFTFPGNLLLFYYLTKGKKYLLMIVGLFLSSVCYILNYISIGQRGGAFYALVTIILTYFIFKKLLSKKIKHVINMMGFSLIIVVALLTFYLTMSRFGEQAINSLFGYIGQGNINFGIYAFDNNGLRYGDRTIPFFKELLGFENCPRNFVELRAKYPNLHINDEVFITFIGDFVLDFGPIIAFMIITIVSLYACSHTKPINREMPFHRLILLHFVACVCMQGGMSLYSFASIGGNLNLIVYFFLYFLFKIDYSLKNNKHIYD